MMCGVMDVVIAQITDDEKSHKSVKIGGRTEKGKHRIEQAHDKNGRGRWHDEPRRIVWVIMVKAVKKIDKAFSELALGVKMKNPAVQYVFGQRPDQKTDHAQQKQHRERQPVIDEC